MGGLGGRRRPRGGRPLRPYRQSARSALYRRYADDLVAAGRAYYAFDTPEELAELRARLQAENHPTQAYDASTRGTMRNALTLDDAEVQRLLEGGADYVVRLRVPAGETVRFEDAVRGPVAIQTSQLDDQVLLKSDGLPTYHLANVVDDHHMGITHVVRGEEWLPSTPKHVLLYRFLGWEPPQMAHLPLILSPEGGKLSKRNAGEMGIPVSVRDYVEAGYEPEALVNFLAFLGWNPGTEKEIYTLDELVDDFALDRVGSSGVQFDLDKLKWYNEQHLRRLSVEELAVRVRLHLAARGIEATDEQVRTAAELMQPRLGFAHELATDARYFFEDPTAYDEKGVQKRWKDDAADLLEAYADRLEDAGAFTAASTEAILRELADECDKGAGRIIHPTRLALSGVTYGPSLFDLMAALGKAACLRRMRRAVDVLG